MLLRADKALLEGFYRELSSLKAWLASMGSSEPPSKEAMATKGPGCADQVVAKQAKFEGLQAALAEVMAIPSEVEERKNVERRLLTLYLDWDEVCQKVQQVYMCVVCSVCRCAVYVFVHMCVCVCVHVCVCV